MDKENLPFMKQETEKKHEAHKEYKPHPMLVPFSIIIAGALIAAAIIYNGRVAPTAATVASTNSTVSTTPANLDSLGLPKGTVTVSLATSNTEGSAHAKVAIVEFGDYQCPYCKQHFQQTEPQLKENYINNGKALFAFKEYPLTSIHPYAMSQAVAALCAGDQGKYWQMHDALYNSGQQNDATALTAMAKSIGADANTFSSCINSGKFNNTIQTDQTQGNNINIQGTPSFVIGKINTSNNTVTGTLVPGAYPYSTFQAVLSRYTS